MRPIVSPGAMRAIDDAAPWPVDVLIERAGWAVAVAARRMLDSAYGSRVALLVGKGNNGADGLAAGRVLGRWGARVQTIDATDLPAEIRNVDLVIDACYGTGFRGSFSAPRVEAPVLAVDIASGIDGTTGAALGSPFRADATVTMVAVKPGLLLDPGRGHTGRIEIADIGLDPGRPTRWWLEAADIVDHWPVKAPNAHKWRTAVCVVGGGPGMTGAPILASSAAARAGAGMVVLASRERVSGADAHLVTATLSSDWDDEVLGRAERFGALIIGPGLPVTEETRSRVRRVVAEWEGPVVVDAGGLDAVADAGPQLRARSIPAVLTPHEGEFRRLGGAIGTDRIASVEELAAALGAVVLLKGATTIVAEPGGRTWLSTAGDQRLATAGSGDVLSGIIGAVLAAGISPGFGAALGAELHGRAAMRGHRVGLVAGDLPELVAEYLSDTTGSAGANHT